MGPFPLGTLVYVQTAAGWEVAQVLATYDDRVEVLLHGVPQVHPLVHVRCVRARKPCRVGPMRPPWQCAQPEQPDASA